MAGAGAEAGAGAVVGVRGCREGGSLGRKGEVEYVAGYTGSSNSRDSQKLITMLSKGMSFFILCYGVMRTS